MYDLQLITKLFLVPVIEVSYMSGSSPDPHTATLTWTKPNCINETQVLNTKYNLTYVYTDHMMVEHTQAMVSSDNFQSVDNLLPYTEYTFTVSPFTGAGDGSLGPPAVVRTQAKSEYLGQWAHSFSSVVIYI